MIVLALFLRSFPRLTSTRLNGLFSESSVEDLELLHAFFRHHVKTEEALQWLLQTDRAAQQRSRPRALLIGLFPLMCLFFKENIASLFCVVEVNTSSPLFACADKATPSHMPQHLVSKNMISGSTGYFSKTYSLYMKTMKQWGKGGPLCWMLPILNPAENVHSWCDSKKREELHQAKSNNEVKSNPGKSYVLNCLHSYHQGLSLAASQYS